MRENGNGNYLMGVIDILDKLAKPEKLSGDALKDFLSGKVRMALNDLLLQHPDLLKKDSIESLSREAGEMNFGMFPQFVLKGLAERLQTKIPLEKVSKK